MKLAQMLALAMLLGSIPFGYIAVSLRGPGTVRDSGASMTNIRGATGLPGLVLVVSLNMAKGLVPVYLARHAMDSYPLSALVGAVAIVSHCFPYWLMFKRSGNGGSVAIGAVLGLFL